MFALITMGRWIYRPFICTGIPLIVATIGENYWPFFHGWGWVIVMLVFMLTSRWIWKLVSDWRELFRVGMKISDTTASFSLPPYIEDRYVAIKLDRALPPRLLWVIVTHNHAIRIYQGWNFWGSRVPMPRKVSHWGIKHKRVA